MQQRNSLIAALSASFAAMFLSFMIHSPWSVPNIYSDIGSFWGRYIQQGLVIYYPVQQGWVPNFQFFFEYPPISGYIFYFARIIGGDYNGYYSAFDVMSLVAALVLAWSCCTRMESDQWNSCLPSCDSRRFWMSLHGNSC